jgi:hypothetical protein
MQMGKWAQGRVDAQVKHGHCTADELNPQERETSSVRQPVRWVSGIARGRRLHLASAQASMHGDAHKWWEEPGAVSGCSLTHQTHRKLSQDFSATLELHPLVLPDACDHRPLTL